MMACQSGAPAPEGLIQASRVIAVDKRKAAESATVTREELPLNDSAPAFLPAEVQVALVTAPVRPLPDASLLAVPAPSLKL